MHALKHWYGAGTSAEHCSWRDIKFTAHAEVQAAAAGNGRLLRRRQVWRPPNTQHRCHTPLHCSWTQISCNSASSPLLPQHGFSTRNIDCAPPAAELLLPAARLPPARPPALHAHLAPPHPQGCCRSFLWQEHSCSSTPCMLNAAKLEPASIGNSWAAWCLPMLCSALVSTQCCR